MVMRLNEMEAIYNYICNDLEPKNINEWQEYKKNMDNFFKALKPYYEADDKKQYKGITEDEYNKISKLFDDVAKASDDLMKAYENVEEKTVGKDGKPIPKVKDIVKNLNDQFFSK
jgi:flagellin-specific chaperone FliS